MAGVGRGQGGKHMKLGLPLGYSGRHMAVPIERVQLAERLGYDSVWTAESYGSDAMTPLAWIAAHTSRIRLGTAIAQLAGRSPAMCAMQAQTVDGLAGGGRFIVGLGVSGPQIVEGWYGRPWGRPYYQLKEYVQIMRQVFRREGPVTNDGEEFPLPYQGPGSSGLGKPLRSILYAEPNLPIWIGAGGEATVRLTAELCDGLLPLSFVPGAMTRLRPWIEEGFRRAGNGKSWKDFEIQASCRVFVTDDVRAAINEAKAERALYIGGMGHESLNFHNRAVVQRGYGDAAARIQELYLAGRKEEAAGAVPDEFIDEETLIGPPTRIRERYKAWAESGITGLNVRTTQNAAVELMAELAREKPARGMV